MSVVLASRQSSVQSYRDFREALQPHPQQVNEINCHVTRRATSPGCTSSFSSDSQHPRISSPVVVVRSVSPSGTPTTPQRTPPIKRRKTLPATASPVASSEVFRVVPASVEPFKRPMSDDQPSPPKLREQAPRFGCSPTRVLVQQTHLRSAAPTCNSSAASRSPKKGTLGPRVVLHVYDLFRAGGSRQLNHVLANRWAPVKFGGLFHVGVEVNGVEYWFGSSNQSRGSGVGWHRPRQHPRHRFRESVCLGRATCSTEDVSGIVSDLVGAYRCDDYDLLRRNCCNFASDFCGRLGVKEFPTWVHRLARVGAGLDDVFHIADFLGV
eukprot:TRINITY_DN51325_c0_g1_i1.p1 TRINITY_DN51325_c0_g1~~TRINITY_DN51325_c0_g1_i1.p1  ORF type:complete len:324 (+),score=31.40 TRINITY_DN51325_c0_g1_i1:70-1041(+)